MDREMIIMIEDTLLVFYYEKMVGYMPSSFVDLVFVDKKDQSMAEKRQIWLSYFDEWEAWGKWRE